MRNLLSGFIKGVMFLSMNSSLQKQISFLTEIDELKQILRQTVLIKDLRQENDAEHSWHLAMMVVLLSEYSNEDQIDVLRTIKMVLVHDIVEIDAGDTFCYDTHDLDEKMKEKQLNVFLVCYQKTKQPSSKISGKSLSR